MEYNILHYKLELQNLSFLITLFLLFVFIFISISYPLNSLYASKIDFLRQGDGPKVHVIASLKTLGLGHLQYKFTFLFTKVITQYLLGPLLFIAHFGKFLFRIWALLAHLLFLGLSPICYGVKWSFLDLNYFQTNLGTGFDPSQALVSIKFSLVTNGLTWPRPIFVKISSGSQNSSGPILRPKGFKSKPK